MPQGAERFANREQQLPNIQSIATKDNFTFLLMYGRRLCAVKRSHQKSHFETDNDLAGTEEAKIFI
ncbi:MAG: hypothetical protein WCT05_03525 [Lentisphaeria bacterium]